MSKVILWSQPNCLGCGSAEAILRREGYTYEKRVIGAGWTKEQFLNELPNARSVPQIVINGNLIGGLQELIKFVK
jgi:glutaredoxin